MATQQTVPSFEFSGFYYFEILRDILRYLRLNVPEITDESDEEAFIQLARAWALSHHYMNVRMDIVANETLLPTARLLESVRSQLKLIDFTLLQATPATTELVMEFSALFTDPSTLIVPRNSQFGTEDTDEAPQIIYESVEDNTITRTDLFSNVFVNPSQEITLSNKSGNLFDFVVTSGPAPQEGHLVYQGGNYAIVSEIIDADTFRLNDASLIVNGAARLIGDNFGADKSGEAQTDSLPFDFGAVEPQPGDLLYLIHETVMWDQIDFVMAQAYKTGITGVWEFFDGSVEDANPDSVTNLGPNLEFDLTTLLGDENKEGTVVQISLPQTSASEQVVSKFVGGKNIAQSTGLLGQVTPTTEDGDYTVGTVWQPLKVISDDTKSDGVLSQNGALSFSLPQTLKENWQKTTINGVTGFALRLRVQELTKSAATLVGTGFNAGGLDTNNYNMNIGFDGYADLEVDVTGDAGVGGGYTLASVIIAINNAMAGLNAALANVASEENGQLKLTAPDAALGKDSEIRVLAPSGQDATNECLGLSESAYPYSFIGIGGIAQIDRARMDQGKQYLLYNVVQGQTVSENPLASSDGSPNQEYNLGFTPLINGTLVVEVNEGAGFTAYDELENFLNADGNRKAYRKEIDADDNTTIFFGDGETGKIPPAGSDNIKATYRIGADQNGNVGAQTIIVNLAGISFVNRIFNPRQASGWAAKQGSDLETLEKAKIEGPASLRTLGKAITPTDIETLGVQFVSPTTGSSPVVRATSIEETFGVKTVELLVVGSSGALLNQTQRDELADYFNGNKPKGIEGVLVTNHEVTPVNYTPKPIDVEVEVTGAVQEEAIKNALIALLNPEAKFDDNVTLRWDFGGLVPTSIIIADIHDTDPVNVKQVNLIQPAADVQLGSRELPIIGNLQVTVLPVT